MRIPAGIRLGSSAVRPRGMIVNDSLSIRIGKEPLLMQADGPSLRIHTVPPRLLISLATYNERDNLAELIAAIQSQTPGGDILVIDDNSPDGTGQLADRLGQADPRIHVQHRAGKLGLGTAILAAMQF